MINLSKFNSVITRQKTLKADLDTKDDNAGGTCRKKHAPLLNVSDSVLRKGKKPRGKFSCCCFVDEGQSAWEPVDGTKWHEHTHKARKGTERIPALHV